mmetsp:Transcript_16242/g.46436  ORF Transcript_16242/g.46436 Transcript_16242/m.46436 type:complete len:323 (+) Transcript_16242:409-1377(+)
MHLLRCFCGKISEQYVHTIGPQVAAKAATKRNTLWIVMKLVALCGAMPTAILSERPPEPTKPNKKHESVQTIAPAMSRILRPKLSEKNIAGNVAMKLTRFMRTWYLIGDAPIISNIRGPKYMNAFMPTNCCNTCNEIPMKINLPKMPCPISSHRGLPNARVSSRLFTMSSNSSRAVFSQSRSRTNASSASSSRPCWANQRGDLGNIGMPKTNNPPGMTCKRIAQRQPSSISTKSWSTNEAINIPKVIMSWYKAVNAPLHCGDETSLWYSETTGLNKPIERPETKRPMHIVVTDIEAACTQQPIKKMPAPKMMVSRRPHSSMK